MTNYLIELSVVHVTLIAGYWFLLRKERQYGKMRFYVIASTLLALVIPFLKLPKLFFNRTEHIVPSLPVNAVSQEATPDVRGMDTSIWNYDLLMWIYMVVSTFFVIKFLISVVHLIRLERKSTHEKFNDLCIRKVKSSKGSFTFFNWIFLSDELDKNHYEIILKHEKAHADLGHTYDIIFFELFKACFWWLPSAWLMNREIRVIHEYQADAYALKTYDVDRYSSILINATLKSNGMSLASSFHDSLILKRLQAMKQQSKKVSPWKLVALSTIYALLFTVFACSEEPKNKETESGNVVNASQSQESIFTIEEKQPEYEGGIDALMRYVMKEIKYPKEARQKGIEGLVSIQFVIEKNGAVSDVKTINGIGAGCDDEAMRVVRNASRFKPGTQNGKPVRVRMVMPIVFKLDKANKNSDNSTHGVIIVNPIQQKNGKLNVDAAYANGEWSGTVRDPEGEALAGVNILIAGTTRGTTSDTEGRFRLKADQSNELYFSFVGYETVKLDLK